MRISYMFQEPDVKKFLLIITILLILDWYIFQLVRTAFQSRSISWQKVIKTIYWAISILVIGLLISFGIFRESYANVSTQFRHWIATFFFGMFLTKIILLLFTLFDDFVRLVQWTIDLFAKFWQNPTNSHKNNISRSEFLAKTGVWVASAPTILMGYGIISGAYNYQVIRRKIYLPNLPKSFHGLRIAQISDIHSGSFFNKRAVEGGVEMLLAEKPDVVFFTGDLVNNFAKEVEEYIPIFGKISPKVPYGVYSVLGNHDYGNYVFWSNAEAKRQNLKDLEAAHYHMGWKLLKDSHAYLEESNERIAIIGVQNWGAKGHFPKYGNLFKAVKNIRDASVKLLLSHDPSHWDAQVRPLFPDIDITFSGHTHGMQFGIEIGEFRWSPVKYIYPKWADLYQENNQYLYVNRGFGFIGFPGRIGILPEITILELVAVA
ncbi:MAG: metallophosphoesterase [Cytophagales bacterium]|nr:metallophosphoesterase [Cytophagales bacterium]MDW8384029.1 metallophosphoesterase [Flammeovirgaceae bacterium]